MIEFTGGAETRRIGVLALTEPMLQKLKFREIVNRYCPIAPQGCLDNGLVSKIIVQSRLSDPRALYDITDWAEDYIITALYPEVESVNQLNDDRIGRMLDSIYEHTWHIWGELITNAAQTFQVDFRRLHADTKALTFAGEFPNQQEEEGVPRLEPGYNPKGVYAKQLKLFALVTGDGAIPAWFDTLNGSTGDNNTYTPEFAAFREHAQLAHFLPLNETIILGDQKMTSLKNQLTWLRLGIGYIGPLTMNKNHREKLASLLASGRRWEKLPYVAQRDAEKPEGKAATYLGLGENVEIKDPENPEKTYTVHHLYVQSSTLKAQEAKKRQKEMEEIEKEIKRIQGLVNKYDYTTPETIIRRVQQKAFKKRRAQRFFRVEVVEHPDRENPLELVYTVDWEQVAHEAEFDGVYLLVAGGSATQLQDHEILAEWKGQYRVEHRFRMLNSIFLVSPIFLKTPKRIAALLFLIMVGALVAGLIERQVRRAVTARKKPIRGLMPENRDNLRPTIKRIFKAFSGYGVVKLKNARGEVLTVFSDLTSVQAQILEMLGLPPPAETFSQKPVEGRQSLRKGE